MNVRLRRRVPFGLRFVAACSLGFAVLVGVLGAGELALVTELPPQSSLPGRSELRDRDGHLVHASLDRAAHRFMAAGPGIEDSTVARVFVAAEDRRIFAHHGVDPIAGLRAALAFFRDGSFRSGASTMAMQLARLREGRRPGFNPWHKLRDAVLAVRLTRAMGTTGVVRAYLDEVPLGPRVVGIEAGARAAFGKAARDLTLAEASVLASFARSPASLARVAHVAGVRDRVRRRALGVLRVLEREGVPVADARAEVPSLVQSLVGERARPVAASSSARFESFRRGASTLDLDLQRSTEGALRAGLARARERGVSHGAAIVVELPSMSVRAVCSLSDSGATWFDATSTLRQPGSTLKPLLAALALEELGAEDLVVDDAPLAFEGDDDAYEPRNYDGRFHGAVPIEDVVARSLNVPTLRLAGNLGTAKVLEFFRLAGLSSLRGSPDRYGANVALGDGEVTLGELVESYGALANDGVARALRFDASAEPRERRVMSADVARIVSRMLDDDRRRAPSFERDGVFSAPYALAAKTGTSRDHCDAWAIGYTRSTLAGVWFGRADGGATREVNGSRGPGPVLRAVLDGTKPPSGVFPPPDDDAWEERRFVVDEHATGAARERLGFRRRRLRPSDRHDVATVSRFVFPAEGARFVVDGSRAQEAQALRVLVVRPRGSQGTVTVRDGEQRVEVLDGRAVGLPLTKGPHRLELVEGGRVVDVRRVEVLSPGFRDLSPVAKAR